MTPPEIKEAAPHDRAGGYKARAKDKADDVQKGDSGNKHEKDDENKGDGSKKSDEDKKKEREDEEKRRKRKPWVIAGGAVAVPVLIVGGVWYWLSSRGKESTDDAYTDGTPVTIAPKVAGYVVELRISDNTRLKAGDLILRIDPRDYEASRDQAQAQLEVAQAQLDNARANLDLAKQTFPARLQQAQAQAEQARAQQQKAEAGLRRQRSVDPRATTQTDIDATVANARVAAATFGQQGANVEINHPVPLNIAISETQVKQAQAQVAQAQAQLETAQLNLSYTELRAPQDGWVTRRNVYLGSYVQAGQSLFSLVSPEVWVTANFKENQLDRMRPGQHVRLEVDAYPHLDKLRGRVDSMQMGSGSRFSAFPAEHATGNFIKIVQRVPVKIVIESGPELIIFRAMQGFFGGGLQTNQQAIILDTFPPEKRSAALSVTAVATIVASALGPTLGGWLTYDYSWHWVFLVNIPIGIAAVFGVLAVVEDPPWVKARKGLHTDYIGIALIAVGLGCLQVMMDRGEDENWFSSSFIVTFAVLAYCGILGAACWLLTARRPVVKLAVLGDRNFAVGVLLIFCMFSMLYASAVVVPQLTQQQFGYTALWAWLVLSPGALVVCMTIPLVSALSNKVETRFMVAAGFAVLGAGLVYSYFLSPQIFFGALAEIRIAQSVGIAMLFVPINAAAFLTISKEDTGDASALFVMFRNVAGSIGISLSTAMVTERTQVRMAHLSANLTPFDQGYVDALARYTEPLVQLGVAQSQLSTTAQGLVYQQLRSQAAIMGNADVFLGCALLAFVGVPLAFLLSGGKGKGGAAG